MRKLRVGVSAFVVLLVAVAAVAQGVRMLRGVLTGYEEVPSISTTADGNFRAQINESEDTVTYELSYKELEGNVLQAHIHLGQPGVNGGISVWLCGNPNVNPPVNPPPGTQPCPPPPATITGTFTGANIVGPAAQGLTTGEFDELVRAIRAGVTYVNVHSTKYPGGEIRSQIGPGHSTSKGKGSDHGNH
jgi:hypothetical protein